MHGWLPTKTESGVKHRFDEIDARGLHERDVQVGVATSYLNYKDGLAMTGALGVARA